MTSVCTTDATIFVSIASYRDPECYWTVRDLFEKAAHPDRIFVGICWQFVWPDDQHHFPGMTRPGQVRFVGYDARLSRGCSWAKHQAQALWQGEDFQLCIDSHMRFHEGWDDALIGMLSACPSKKPILSCYPACYEPPDKLSYCSTPLIVPREFDPGKSAALFLESAHHRSTAPRLAAFIAGGFNFSAASFLEEVPHDPELYFIGLELGMSLRAFSRGWDVFSPHQCLLHHYYTQKDVQKHWEDDQAWWQKERRSVARLHHLLGIAPSDDPEVVAGLDGPQGLGSERSLEAFERFAGLDFKERTVSEAARRGKFPVG